jgi:site-specific DNA-cytosine methylase
MRVLVACEYSGRVRDAFRRRGHDAMSCDLLPTEIQGPHYQGPVEDVLHDGWDLMVAHPPCTHLAVSGSRHFERKIADGSQAAALDFVRLLMAAPIERWCIENPVSVISSAIRPPDQIIQPWEYGHGEVKATCFWLKNLPKLRPTQHVEGREERVHKMPPGPNRWKERSRTFEGVADAMGDQWGGRALPACIEQLALLSGRS